METKLCKNCKDEKALNEYHKDVRYYLGVKSICKKCYYEKYKDKKKAYFEKNKYKIYTKHKEYRVTAKEKNLAKHKEWIKNNRDKIRESDRLYSKNRKKVDLYYKIKCNLRSKISYELRNNKKTKLTLEILGCTIEQFKQHLESKFKEGMSWDNYGQWHIDHIKPCASFDFSKPEQQKECFHYTNTQPLWAKENIIKSNKI